MGLDAVDAGEFASLKTLRKGQVLGWARKLQFKCDQLAETPGLTTRWLREAFLPVAGGQVVSVDVLEPGDLGFLVTFVGVVPVLFLFRDDPEFGASLTPLVDGAVEMAPIAGEDLVAVVDFYLDLMDFVLQGAGGAAFASDSVTASDIPSSSRGDARFIPLNDFFREAPATATEIARRHRATLLALDEGTLRENISQTTGRLEARPGGWRATFPCLPSVDIQVTCQGDDLTYAISATAAAVPARFFKYACMVLTNALVGWR